MLHLWELIIPSYSHTVYVHAVVADVENAGKFDTKIGEVREMEYSVLHFFSGRVISKFWILTSCIFDGQIV